MAKVFQITCYEKYVLLPICQWYIAILQLTEELHKPLSVSATYLVYEGLNMSLNGSKVTL